MPVFLPIEVPALLLHLVCCQALAIVAVWLLCLLLYFLAISTALLSLLVQPFVFQAAAVFLQVELAKWMWSCFSQWLLSC